MYPALKDWAPEADDELDDSDSTNDAELELELESD